MGKGIYLLNICVSGIKCIKEEVRLDFYKKTVDRNFNPERYRVKAIYGENGSGKSAIITAVKIFQDLMMFTHYLTESKTQEFLDEIVNKTERAFRFDCEFLVWGEHVRTVFHYSVHVGKSEAGLYEIQYERLRAKNGKYANNKYKTVFEIENGEIKHISCTDNAKEVIEKVTTNLLSTYPFIYLYVTNCKKIAVPEEKSFDGDFLVTIIMCAALPMFMNVYIGEEDQHELYFLNKRLKESGLDRQSFVDEIFGNGNGLNMALGVNEKFVEKEQFDRYKERVGQLTEFIKIFKPNLVSIEIDKKENGNQYVCDLNLNYGDYMINKEFESTGIKKLIRLFDCFMAASTGRIVFVDEMDANLNDVYLCKLIEYFMYYGKGQLCFTTHNLDPMTVLKENRNSIDFLSSDNHLVPWTSRGNASPENCYKNGLIEDSPFNIEATDFVGILGE